MVLNVRSQGQPLYLLISALGTRCSARADQAAVGAMNRPLRCAGGVRSLGVYDEISNEVRCSQWF